MLIGLITNDYFDAVHSRKRMAEWFKKHKGIEVRIAVPEFEKGIADFYYFKSRGFSVKSLRDIRAFTRENDLIIYRGIEVIFFSLFINHQKKDVYYLLTGLGKVYAYKGIGRSLFRFMYRCGIQILLRKNKARLIFQNKQDPRDLNIKKYHLMRGSGHTRRYTLEPKPFKDGKIKVVTCTRLTESKGIREIFTFANAVKYHKDIQFIVCGDYGHLGVDIQETIEELNKLENVNFKGFCADVESEIRLCDYAFFPTRYREGSPRFLIEAASYGLNLITTNMPGCDYYVANGIAYKHENTKDSLQWILQRREEEYILKSQETLNFYKNNFVASKVFEGLYHYINKR